jgi:hypothetical protein
VGSCEKAAPQRRRLTDGRLGQNWSAAPDQWNPAPKAVRTTRSPGLDAALFAGLSERQRNGRRASVAVAVNIDVDLLLAQTHLVADGLDDAQVRLVRNDQGDLIERATCLLEDGGSGFRHPLDRLAVDLTTVHNDVVVAILLCLFQTEGAACASGLEGEDACIAAFGPRRSSEEFGVHAVTVAEDHRAGTITEQDACRPVLPIHEP